MKVYREKLILIATKLKVKLINLENLFNLSIHFLENQSNFTFDVEIFI